VGVNDLDILGQNSVMVCHIDYNLHCFGVVLCLEGM
jgi:hypothetical protein